MEKLATIVACTTLVSTDQLQQEYPNPSLDPMNPTHVHFRNICLISYGSSWRFSHGLEKVHTLNALPEHDIRFYMTSEYNNYQSSVIQYALFTGKRSPVLGPDVTLITQVCEESIYPKTFDPLITATEPRPETYAQTKILKHGRERLTQQFAVYTQVRGYSVPQLYGYFEWHPVISIVK